MKKDAKTLVKDWFDTWGDGDFQNLPIAVNFKHTSPFGTINGKSAYLDLVTANKEKFLGYQFDIVDAIYEDQKACVRYIASQTDFKLEVSEWHYIQDNLIGEVVAYYHIGEIREERTLKNRSD